MTVTHNKIENREIKRPRARNTPLSTPNIRRMRALLLALLSSRSRLPGRGPIPRPSIVSFDRPRKGVKAIIKG